MSYSILQWIEIKCPTLYTDSNVQQWIDGAKLLYDENCYDDVYNLVVALRACHDYTVTNNQNNLGGTGQISSKREGDQAISFSNNMDMNSDQYLQLTSYGKQIISIKRARILGISATGTNADDILGGCFPCVL